MPSTANELVWYAAYGSNLCRLRFACYVRGGAPSPTHRDHPGCRDRTLPVEDRPVTIPHRLYFAGDSRSWGGGGVAYLDPERDATARTLGRAWLLTVEQLADVVAQENARRPPGPALLLDDVVAAGAMTLGAGAYEHLLALDPVDGIPAVTFTCARRLPSTAPGAAYRATVVAGLVECHGLAPDEAEAYIDACAGAR